MYKNELNDRIILEIIDIIKTRPSWWIIYTLYIVNNNKITYKKDTTIIISIYMLKPHRIVILFNILKRFYKLELIHKIIFKKEFVIVHMVDTQAFMILTDKDYWKELLIYSFINKQKLILKENDTIKCINNQIVFSNFETNIYKETTFSYYIPTLEKRIKELLENNKS